MIFPALYNGPINYYARLVQQELIVLEQHDSYTKQSYRNRCLIMGPNGVIPLSIPVSRKHGKKTPMHEIRIDYGSHWDRIHWRSLVASYASSPYFEYLIDEIKPVYQKKFNFLIDLNRQLIDLTLGILGLNIQITYSEVFTPISSEEDPRFFIHPKKNQEIADPSFHPKEYRQVFSDRLGFRPNLSILDLIFNEGPLALPYLRTCLKT